MDKKQINNLFFIIILFIFIASPVQNTYANDTALGLTPDGVFPISQSQIMMVSEEIYIVYNGFADAEVICRFDFKNLGKAQSVLMGFPAMLDEEINEMVSEERISVRNFTAKDEDGEIPVELVDSVLDPLHQMLKDYSKWYTFSVDFDENEVKTLYHTYNIKFTYDSLGFCYMGYVIETGAVWEGPIGHSKVTFDMGDTPLYSITEIKPDNYYRIEGNKIIFERSNFEPYYNLWVTQNDYIYGDEWLEDKDEEIREKAKQKMVLFKASPEEIQDNSQYYLNLYNELINTDAVCALYIKSALNVRDDNQSSDNNPFQPPQTSQSPDNSDMESAETQEHEDTDPDQTAGPAEAESSETPRPSETESGEITKPIKGEPSEISYTTNTPQPSELPYDPYTNGEVSSSPENDDVSAYAENGGQKVIPTEEETLPILTIGVVIILLICLTIVFFLFIKRRHNGYIFFICQISLLGLSFHKIIQLLKLRDVTNGAMLSENISLIIGLCALYWALSMIFMMIGILLVSDKKKQ